MATRRALLTLGSRAAAAAMLPRVSRRLLAQTQPPPVARTPVSKPDEMTVNSAPQPEHYPLPDFGSPPATLPFATAALRGANSLKEHAHRHDLLAGAAVVVHDLQSDPALQQLVAEQYAILVPENELKWRALRPVPAAFDFTQSDALFAFAAQHATQVRGHTLIWHNSVPDWLRKDVQYNVRQLMVEHIRTVVGRYRGRVHSWDVVNEAILPTDGQPNDLRKSFWYDAVGPDYIELAYRTAHEADPQAKLSYNDYGVEYDSDDNAARRASIIALLQSYARRMFRSTPLESNRTSKQALRTPLAADSPITSRPFARWALKSTSPNSTSTRTTSPTAMRPAVIRLLQKPIASSCMWLWRTPP